MLIMHDILINYVSILLVGLQQVLNDIEVLQTLDDVHTFFAALREARGAYLSVVLVL